MKQARSWHSQQMLPEMQTDKTHVE